MTSTIARAEMPVDALIEKIDGQFRSSSRWIPAEKLHQLSFAAIPAAERIALSDFDQAEVVAALKRLDQKLDVNRGVAENILKIQRITSLCRSAERLTPTDAEQECERVTRDGVAGLGQNELDSLVESFRPKTDKHAHEYSYPLDKLMRLGVRSALNNDWYKFKMAAVIFEYGFHKTKRVTYNMFSRGKENRSYYVVGGTSLAIDAIPYFRFDESDIQFIKNHPQMSKVSPEFFEYLRTWRFGRNPETGKVENTGWIRAVPEGTIVFPNETIMEITSDPLSATLIECLLSPLIDAVSTSATKAARITSVSGAAQPVEGGTRRSGKGPLGAYGALIGGFVGTSNAYVAEITGTDPFGSMEHALISLFKSQLRALIGFERFMPQSTHLIDEGDILEGALDALDAAGLGLVGTRTDSEIEGLGLGGTTNAISELFEDFGMDPKQTVSDRIDEFKLEQWPPEKSKHKGVLIGTEVQNPSDANGSNIVYKIVQVTDLPTGAVRPVAKASVGKVGIPGETEVYRVSQLVEPDATGVDVKRHATHDVIAVKGEMIDGTPLLVPALEHDGRRSLPRVPIWTSAQLARTQFAMFDPVVTSIHAKRGAYEVKLSPALAAKQKAVLKEKNEKKYRVGIQIGSFNPVTEAHVRVMKLARRLLRFDKSLVIPAHDEPVHGKEYVFKGEERLKMLRTKYEPLGIEVDEREVKGPPKPFTINTARQIKTEATAEFGRTELTIVVGDDVFDDLVDNTGKSRWIAHRTELLNGDFSWAVHRRFGDGKLHIPDGVLGPEWEKLDERHYEHLGSGAMLRAFDFRVGNAVSSTVQRERATRVDTILHGVDLQDTFWEGIGLRPPGTLAVGGSNRILQNVIRLTQVARKSARIKSILTKDFHFEIELRDPRFNQEFHGPKAFPPHGMAERSGAAGHEIIWEVKDIFPPQYRLVVPHNYHRRGPTPADDTLELANFDPSDFAYEIMDPDVQLVVQKNGPRSFDFRRNPNSEKVLSRLKAKKVYVYGVATDYCVKDAARTYLRLGYDVSLITDAIAGIGDRKSQRWIDALVKAGAKLTTTEEVLREYSCEHVLGNS